MALQTYFCAMPHHVFPGLLLGLSLLAASCFSPRKTSQYFREREAAKKKVKLNEVRITPARPDLFRTSAARQIDILHMDLAVAFQWAKKECTGKETLLLTPYYFPTDSLVLDAKNMVFDRVELSDLNENPILHLIDYDKKRLKLQLEKKLKPGDTVRLTLSYTAKPYELESGGSSAIRDDRGLYFINADAAEPFKPQQIWTQGETEANSCWFPTIDKPNEKFTSTLSITVNKNLVTLSNGIFEGSVENGNLRTDTWRNEKPMPAYLTMMAIGDFTVTKDEWRGKEVSYYLEPDYKAYARRIFRHTTEMLEFFSNRLGVEYPWNKYAQVVVRDYVSGAMENTSATLHGEFVQKNDRELSESDNDGIIAHELFHQWFGDLITCESWSHLVVNEGFASYGEQLWTEHRYGRDAALQKAFGSMDRYLNYAKRNSEGPIVDFRYRDKEDMFNALTYQKGARVLNLLRHSLGDETFFATLKLFLTRHAYANAEIDDLRRCVEDLTGQDYRPFFEQWFFRGGHPVLDVHYEYPDSTGLAGVTIEQVQPAEQGVFTFPLQFRVTQGNKEQTYSFNISRKKETFFVRKLDNDNADRVNINLDPNTLFIGEIKDNKSFLQHITTYLRAGGYPEKHRALEALKGLQAQQDTVRQTMLRALTDPDADIRLKTLGWIDWTLPEMRTRGTNALLQLAQYDSSAGVRSAALRVLGQAKNPEWLDLYDRMLRDSSYNVAASALLSMHALLPEEALRRCPDLSRDLRGKLFSAVSEVYAASGALSDSAFFLGQWQKVFQGKRAGLADDYTTLILRTASFEKVLDHTRWLETQALIPQGIPVQVAAVRQLKAVEEKFSKLAEDTKDAELKKQFSAAATTVKERRLSVTGQLTDRKLRSQLKTQGLLEEAATTENE